MPHDPRGPDADRAARFVPGHPMSDLQIRALLALVRLCPEAGQTALPSEVAAAAGLRPNAGVLVLRGLDRRGLARPAHEDDRSAQWWPTYDGRVQARALGSAV